MEIYLVIKLAAVVNLLFLAALFAVEADLLRIKAMLLAAIHGPIGGLGQVVQGGKILLWPILF